MSEENQCYKTAKKEYEPTAILSTGISGKQAFPLLIYEVYKPRNLEEVKEYAEYMLNARSIIANEVDDLEVDQEERFHDYSSKAGRFLSHSAMTEESRLHSYVEERKNFNAKHEEYLHFDSNFECGNLEQAYVKSSKEYDLYVNSDTNAFTRCQWFYFMISNTVKNTTVKFNVVNVYENNS